MTADGYQLFTRSCHSQKNSIHPRGIMITPVTTPSQTVSGAGRDQVLMRKAKELETAFLSEMLAFTGLGAAPEGFGGGAGEEQFSSFLRSEQARLMVDRGGIGLAQQIFMSLKHKEGGQDAIPRGDP